MNNEFSSVEWLLYEISLTLEGRENSSIPHYKLMELGKKAKAMHNKEVVDFVEDWYCNGPLLGGGVDIEATIHQHYNETFGGTHE
jgi:hypothetical protein